MVIGVVGLGLIGGSIAKAYKATESGKHTVLAQDIDLVMLQYAVMLGAVDEKLTVENIGRCDVLFLSVYPEAAVEFLRQYAPKIDSHTLVIDCCGTKQGICETGFALAKEYGFTFVGGHPMAGNHHSGFKYSREDMFTGAPMVIVPPVFDDMDLLNRVKTVLEPLGLGSISVTSAKDHDRMIAFTSQMAHIVSNAYVKSPEAARHKGFSAGSYKDLTRVAWLNPDMWTELFLENRDNLLEEVDGFLRHMEAYREALAANDRQQLWNLLDEGRKIKGEIDG